jgi:hypothetical protein
MMNAPPPELISVAPRGELRTQRLADPNQLRAVTELGETDVLRRHTASRVAVESLGALDRLPSLL